MKRLSIIKILLSLVCISLYSCRENISENSMWGATQYYEDFFWYKYEPVLMEQTLEFNFNEDARQFLEKEVFTFDVVELDENGNVIQNQFKLYKNGIECPNETFTLTTSDSEIRLGIEFLPEAREGNHKFFIKEKENSGLTRIDYTELAEGMYVQKNDSMNPLAKLLAWSGGIIVVVSIIWAVLSRFLFWPSVRFSKLTIDYGNGCCSSIRTSGCYEVVLTNDKKMHDNFLIRLFKGSKKYVVNDFWTSPIEIKNGFGKKIRVRQTKRSFSCSPINPKRKEDFILMNADGHSVTLHTN